MSLLFYPEIPRVPRTLSSATATGYPGQIYWDANYIYICIATNTWVRSPLSTWTGAAPVPLQLIGLLGAFTYPE